MKLDLDRTDPNRLSLGIPIRARLVPSIVAGFLIYGLLSAKSAEQAVAWTLLVPALAAALFDDRWTFDRQVVTRRLGLIFLARTTTYTLSELKGFYVRGALVKTRKGLSPASYCALGIVANDDRQRRIEQYRGRGSEQLITLAGQLATFCELPVDDQVRRTDA